MSVEIQNASPSKPLLYTGYTLSVLSILFFLFDASIKFTTSDSVTQALTQLGIPMHLSPAIGVIALVCIALYALPPTSILGSVLLTGYLGGAIALHLRVGNPLFSHILFPVYIALFIWGGIWLRDQNLRQVFPFTPKSLLAAPPKKQLWTGYILTALSALMMIFTAVMKFTYTPPPGSQPAMGFPFRYMHTLGFIEFSCIALYLIPRTSVLGTVLLSAYLGGATAVNLRAGESVGSSLIPALISVVLWAGLWLRDSRLRRLIPLRSM